MSNKPMFIKPHEVTIAFIPDGDRYFFELTGQAYGQDGKAGKHQSMFSYGSVVHAQAVAEAVIQGIESPINGRQLVIL